MYVRDMKKICLHNSVCVEHCLALFRRTKISLNLLNGMSQRDEVTRQEDISFLVRTLDSWYYGFGSPAIPGFLESVENDIGGTTEDTSMHALIKEQLPDIVRISLTCPIQDIRMTANKILMDFKTRRGFVVLQYDADSPSYMIDGQKIEHLNCLLEEPSEGEPFYTTFILFRDNWFDWGRLENYACIMGYHPEYLECHLRVKKHLFQADLPLPYPDRYYLGVLAAAEQGCIYLVLLFAKLFLASGGDANWLSGIQYGPAKWRQLADLNSCLVHQPWTLTPEHVYDLTHCGDSRSVKETLSLSELMHAIAIFSYVHALSSFIFGCGIRLELDHSYDCLLDQQLNQRRSLDSSPDAQGNLSAVEYGCCEGDHHSDDARSSTQSPAIQLLELIRTEDVAWEALGEDMVARQFQDVLRLHKRLDSEPPPPAVSPSAHKSPADHPCVVRFVHSPQSGYKNFDGRPLHDTEYCWEDEGCALVNRLCMNLGTLLREKCNNAYELTYNTLNSIQDVDTTLYRHTLWNFIQSLYGICHDDFNYDKVGRLLTQEQLAFLKICTTRPAATGSRGNNCDIFPYLTASEFVHVIMMVIEAKQQACLIYAVRAISECQSRSR